MAKHFFVAGTDTGVGKTQTCVGLLQAAGESGLSSLALKPVASGAEDTGAGLRNADALALQSAMSLPLAYEEINPWCFEPAIAPHIAAQQAGEKLDGEQIVETCRRSLDHQADFALIEGAGGWRVPLNEADLFSMIPQRLDVPVILVVGMRLGCINHALLTAEAILSDGIPCAGWVASNTMQEMPGYIDNLLYLKDKIPFCCLGEVPYIGNSESAVSAKYIYKKMLNILLSLESGLQ